ncbi:transcriptional regulator, partial [Escherichia coli]|nr:hemolysin activation protein [Escherichia coli]MBL4231597.1 transcriptional regulator [Escherichia coli]
MAARNTSGDAGKVNSHTRYKLTLAELEAFNSAVDNRLAELTMNK